MTAEDIERDRKHAEHCQYQRGTQGVWARKWLALYAWSHADEKVRELLPVRVAK